MPRIYGGLILLPSNWKKGRNDTGLFYDENNEVNDKGYVLFMVRFYMYDRDPFGTGSGRI